MKKLVLALFILLLAVGGGAWWLLRGSSSLSSLEEGPSGFTSESQGVGRLLRFQEGGTPLRTFQWVRPNEGGVVVAQILTQTDHQQIALFKDGQIMARMHVPRPDGISEGFYRFAQLRDALVVPGNAVVLLYRAQDATAADVPVILALDLKTQAIRWCHRALVERLTLWPDPKGDQVFGFSGQEAVVRLPLALLNGEREGAKPPRAAAQTTELPPEIAGVTDLVPTGSKTFLLSHRMGLSAYLGEDEWHHVSAPTANALGFVEPRSSLASTGKIFWWQPEPGTTIQVKMDGTPIAMLNAKTFGLPGPSAKDGDMLQLLGADSEGRLWFGLATPTLVASLTSSSPSPITTPPPIKVATPQMDPDKAPAPENKLKADSPATKEAAPPPPEAPDRTAWEGYLHQGLDRLYCWDAQTGALKRTSWSEYWRTLGPPPDLTIPMGAGSLRAASGGFLFSYGTQAWWLPLAALPLTPTSISGKALPPPDLPPLVVRSAPTPSLTGLPGSSIPSTPR